MNATFGSLQKANGSFTIILIFRNSKKQVSGFAGQGIWKEVFHGTGKSKVVQ